MEKGAVIIAKGIALFLGWLIALIGLSYLTYLTKDIIPAMVLGGYIAMSYNILVGYSCFIKNK